MITWKETTVSDLAEAFSGYAFASEDLVDNGIPVLKIGNIQNKEVSNTTDSFYDKEITSKLKKYILRKQDFLIAMTGAGSVGRVGKMRIIDKDYLINQRVAIVRSKDSINSDFLYYYFTMPFVERYLYSLGIGAGQPNISAKDILKTKLEIPDLNTQYKIASILSAYDELIENNNKRIKILEQMAENLYKEWFVRFRFPGYENAEFEDGIPKGWEVIKVKNSLKRLPFNRLYKQDELENSGQVIVIDQSSSEYLGYHNNEPSHYASFEEPIILFGDHSCKFAFMTKNFSLGENVVPFKSISTDEFDNYYLYYAVYKLIITEEYKRHWGRFTAMKIFKPQIGLQKKYAEFVKPLVQKKEMLWSQNQNLIKQRDLLLPRLMSGKLEV